MPAYDFRCKDCRTTFSLEFASYAEHERAKPVCPRCGSARLSHLIRRVAYAAGDEARMERLADPSKLGGLDENDPRSMGRMLREMARESGEDVGGEFNEVVDRRDSGESPDSIEKSMPDLGGDMGGDLPPL